MLPEAYIQEYQKARSFLNQTNMSGLRQLVMVLEPEARTAPGALEAIYSRHKDKHHNDYISSVLQEVINKRTK